MHIINYQTRYLLNSRQRSKNPSQYSMVTSSSAIFATSGQMIITIILLILLESTTSHANFKLPKSDTKLLEFPLNLEYLECEFFLFGSLGRGLDQIQPNLTGGGPPPIGVKQANLSALIRDIITQFGYQEVGHVRFILVTLLLLEVYGYLRCF